MWHHCTQKMLCTIHYHQCSNVNSKEIGKVRFNVRQVTWQISSFIPVCDQWSSYSQVQASLCDHLYLNTWLFTDNYTVIPLALIFFETSMITWLQKGTLYVFITSGRGVCYNYSLFCFIMLSCNKIISKISITTNQMQFSYKSKIFHCCMMLNTNMISLTCAKNVEQQQRFRILIHQLIQDVHYPTNHKKRQSSQYSDGPKSSTKTVNAK
jgi:hypothetical protein